MNEHSIAFNIASAIPLITQRNFINLAKLSLYAIVDVCRHEMIFFVSWNLLELAIPNFFHKVSLDSLYIYLDHK